MIDFNKVEEMILNDDDDSTIVVTFNGIVIPLSKEEILEEFYKLFGNKVVRDGKSN